MAITAQRTYFFSYFSLEKLLSILAFMFQARTFGHNYSIRQNSGTNQFLSFWQKISFWRCPYKKSIKPTLGGSRLSCGPKFEKNPNNCFQSRCEEQTVKISDRVINPNKKLYRCGTPLLRSCITIPLLMLLVRNTRIIRILIFDNDFDQKCFNKR